MSSAAATATLEAPAQQQQQTRPHFRNYDEYCAAVAAANDTHARMRNDSYYGGVCRMNNDPNYTPKQRREAMQAWVNAGETSRAALSDEIAELQRLALESGVL